MVSGYDDITMSSGRENAMRKQISKPWVQGSETKNTTVLTDISVSLTFEDMTCATKNFNVSNSIRNRGFGATHKVEISPGALVIMK